MRNQKRQNVFVPLFTTFAAALLLTSTAFAQLQAPMAPIAGCDSLDSECPDLFDMPLCPYGETDDSCEECPPGTDGPGEGCEGMPRFWISSPYINIRIEDVPLIYPTARGKPMKFQLSYRQRGNLPEQSDIFGVGPNWSCNFRAYMVEITNSGISGVPGALRHHRGGAGLIKYHGNNRHATLGAYASIRAEIDPPPSITYRNGTVEWFGRKFTRSNGTNYWFLSERIDPAGRHTYFYYDTNPNLIRLTQVRDVDGNYLRIEYDLNFPTRIARVIDPYNRTNFLFYHQVSGALESIVDVAGITNTFTYDSLGWVETMTTPYGPTQFRTMGVDSNSPAFFSAGDQVNRAVEVTLPGGGKHLYAYRHQSSFLEGGHPAIQNTHGIPAMFDDQPVLRNSFHWGPLQHAALSSGYLNDPQPWNLTVDDYAIARLRHWLAPTTGSGCSDVLALERKPSPDRTTPGQVTWLDYAGKTSASCVGTSGLPSMVAQSLPNGDTWLAAYQRNDYRKVTQKSSTYTAPGGATQLRTDTFVYTNEVDLALHIGPVGEQVVSNFYGVMPHFPKVTVRGTNLPTTFDYTAYGQLTLSSNAAGLTTVLDYDSSGWLVNSYEYELQGANVVYHRSGEMTYNNGLVRTRKNERGVTTTFYWDALSRPTGTSDPRGSTTNLYSALDLSASRDRLGSWTRLVYDNDRRLTHATNANQTVTRYGYCPCGSLESVTLGLGTDAEMMASFAYDLQGRRTNIFLPDSTLTRWFDAAGQVERESGPRGDRWFFYNNQGLLTCVSNCYGIELATVYDIHDRPIYVTNASKVTITNTFDELGRLLSRGYPDGGVEHFAYSPRGLVGYTNQIAKTSSFGYDATGKRIWEYNANQELIQFFHDRSGNLTNLLNHANGSTRWGYDQYSRATNKVDQGGQEIFAWTYNAGDQLISRQTPAKGTTWYTNDAIGNLVAINYPNSPDVFLRYDALNRLTNMVDGLGTHQFAYTPGGLFWTETGPFAVSALTNTYMNRLRTGLALQQPTGRWTNGFGFDLAGRLTNVISQAGSFGYELGARGGADALVKRLRLPSGAAIYNGFDEVGRLIGTFLTNSTGVLLNKHEYSYNDAGQREQQIFPDSSFADYTYDNIGQLTNADSSVALEDRSYGFDTRWNLTNRLSAGTPSVFLVDHKNQLTNAAGNTLGYDANGNLVTASNGCNVLVYDDENRLTQWFFYQNGAAQPGAGDKRTDFAYDGFGRLRKRVEFNWAQQTNPPPEELLVVQAESQLPADDPMTWMANAEVRYLYDGFRVIQERDSNNIPTVSYTRGRDLSGSLQGAGGIGGLLARSHIYGGYSGNWSGHNYYHADGNGNISKMVSPGHVVAASYRYDPFGNLVSKSGPLADANVYRFSSKEVHVNSGLYYYGYRFYSPNLQRWINQDPIGEWGGMNLYGFVGNNPVNYLDSDGLFYWGDDDDFPTLPSGSVLDSYVWDPELVAEIQAKENQALDELLSLGVDAAKMAASMCPGVGEAMDAATLADEEAAWWEKSLAGGSLCLNGMSGGVLPNYSALQSPIKAEVRALTQADLGIHGVVAQLKGTVAVNNGIANVRIGALVGEINNPLALLSNLAKTAKAEGAVYLRIESMISENSGRLREILTKRYGLFHSDSGWDVIIIAIE